MKNRTTYIIATVLLLFVFLITILSIREDSFTFDEVAHVAAGYSYLTQKDYRMNPEHPPLIKDLAALPLLFLHLNFPADSPTWTQATPAVWWHQFDFGFQFLYHSGNNPDKILFWSRIPMILVLLFLGWFMFIWSKKLFGNKAALLSVFLFAFFPIFLAHGRLVTTDIGAALGVIISTYFWLRFLKNPDTKSIFLAGIMFGIAMLLKFSLILLLPFFFVITLVYVWLKVEGSKKYLKYIGFSLLSGIIGLVFIIWPVYLYHTWNYPIEKQVQDTQDLLATTAIPQSLANIDIALAKNPILRPLGQYTLGLFTAMNRSTSGNTTYFLGQISDKGWRGIYFPVVYLIKNPLSFHLLTLIALLYAAFLIKRPFWKDICSRKKEWIKNHFTEFSMLFFIVFYWMISLSSELNIGVRHLMPVFPFTIMLVSGVIANFLKEPFLKLKYSLVGILLLWQALSVIAIYPHFLAYFNELVGGPDKGYLYAVDSNLDWGQDLKRLAVWANENKIDKIYLDYFGGGDANYYLGEKFIQWSGSKDPNEIPKGSYFAVSVTQMQGGRAKPAKGFSQSTSYYNWLSNYEPPVAKIGYSIFVYKIQ